MKIINEKEYIWAEKYRPQCIDDVIFPQKEKEKIKQWIQEGQIPNLGFFGDPGLGKDSLINAIKKELNTDMLTINGSNETGVDTFRGKILNYATKKALQGKIRIVYIQEADYLTPNAQAIARAVIEEVSENTRFIFSANYPERLSQPLLNRLQIFDFNDIFTKYKDELKKQIFMRLAFILKNENIQYTKEQVAEIIKMYYPSTREMIMTLQKNIVDGKLDLSNLTLTSSIYDDIMSAVKERNFEKTRALINELANPETFYPFIWKNLDKYYPIQKAPEIVVLTATYQDMSYRAKNKYITLMAFLTKLMEVSK